MDILFCVQFYIAIAFTLISYGTSEHPPPSGGVGNSGVNRPAAAIVNFVVTLYCGVWVLIAIASSFAPSNSVFEAVEERRVETLKCEANESYRLREFVIQAVKLKAATLARDKVSKNFVRPSIAVLTIVSFVVIHVLTVNAFNKDAYNLVKNDVAFWIVVLILAGAGIFTIISGELFFLRDVYFVNSTPAHSSSV